MTNPMAILGQNQQVSDPAQTRKRFDDLLNSANIFVFMKGTPDDPQCGFSANTVGILKSLGVHFESYDILIDPTMRQAIKDFSGWPTFPQVYFKGQLIGGNDVITEMHKNGELKELFTQE